jgi:hypothetical protein
MKEKDNNTNLAARQTDKGKCDNHRGSLLYSAGEDFYNMYHIDRDTEPEIVTIISGITRKLRKN